MVALVQGSDPELRSLRFPCYNSPEIPVSGPLVISPTEAVRRYVAPGDRVLMGTGAGAAVTLHKAMVADVLRLDGLKLISGIQLGEYTFMDPVRNGQWRYDTWHVTPQIHDDVDSGTVGVHMCRGSLIPRLIRHLEPDIFLTTVSRPNSDGMVSFGASVSYALPMAASVGRVVAEINPEMPFTHGNTKVALSTFDAVVEATEPLPSYAPRNPTEIDRQIAVHVRSLLPENATLQGGLGSVSEALVELLGADPPDGLRLFGMGIDGMIPFLESVDRRGAFVGGELLGTDRLYRFAHNNPVIENRPIEQILSVPEVAMIPRFVSLNSAIEIDLAGQVNAEWVGGRQISGAGGSLDFVDSTWLSEGGLSIIALRSTARSGTVSTIVPSLRTGTPITIPRHYVRFVVTEQGIADLWGLTARERAEELITIAHPDFRDQLEASLT